MDSKTARCAVLLLTVASVVLGIATNFLINDAICILSTAATLLVVVFVATDVIVGKTKIPFVVMLIANIIWSYSIFSSVLLFSYWGWWSGLIFVAVCGLSLVFWWICRWRELHLKNAMSRLYGSQED